MRRRRGPNRFTRAPEDPYAACETGRRTRCVMLGLKHEISTGGNHRRNTQNAHSSPMSHPTDQKQRILLLTPPCKHRILRDYYCCTYSKTGYLWQPIDLLVQSGILGARHEVSVCDAVALAMDPDAALNAARAFRPTAVFSLIGSLSLDSDLAFLKELQTSTRAKIIVSGDAVLHSPALFLETHPWIHAALLNFTADDIAALASDETHKITDSAFRTGGTVHVRRNLKPREFRYPLPLHSAFAGKAYNMPYAPAGFATVLTSFGCPFSCAFCNSGAHSIGFSFRDIDNVEEEIRFLHSRGARHIFFKDMTFGLDMTRTRRLCRFLIDNCGDMTWHAYTRLDLTDEERLDLYAQSGCRLLQIGLETADAGTGLHAGKSTDPVRIKEAFRLMKTKGIAAGAHFILGLPTARATGDLKTVALALRLNPGYASFNVFSPRPGSQFFEAGARGAHAAFPLKMLVRAAYLAFYLHPLRMLSLFSKRKSPSHIKSLISIIRYLLFLPDMKAPCGTNPQPGENEQARPARLQKNGPPL